MAGEIRRLYFADGVSTTPAVQQTLSRKISVVLSAETSKNVDVSSIALDARDMIWQLKKPAADNYEQIDCTITTPSATSVFLDFGGFSKTGTFILLGV
jgi:hypothetical protein